MDITQRVYAFRRELPQLKGKVFFNHGAAAVTPTSVVNACIDGMKSGADYSISSKTKEKWLAVKDETRRMAGELIGAPSENIAFVANTSTALSLISLAIPWKKGDNVITSVADNPATVVPWQNLRHLGVEVRYLPADRDDLVDLDALPKLVDNRTRLVALSLVEYSTGQRLDLKRVAAFCRPRGILVSADAIQALGAVPVDVRSLGVNFLSSGAQKWLIGPRNIGILYADDAAFQVVRSPIVTESNVRDIKVEEEQPTSGIPELKIHEGGLKFEAVPYSNFCGIYGLRQALLNIRSVGQAAMHKRLREITDELVEGLNRLEGRVVSPRGENEWSGIVSFAPHRAPARDAVARLLQSKAYVALRKGRIRICPHYYNTSAEVRKFLSLMRDILDATRQA